MGKKDKENLEKVYEKPGAVWTEREAPKELIELIETGKIKPCKVIDIGCGEGFYSIYLSSKGFDVTGIDISENAIKYAKENAKKRGVKVRFIAMDIKDLSQLREKFDFILEWAVMHHILPPQRKKYIEDVNKRLNKNGIYLSISFNDQNPDFNGIGKKYRIIPKNSGMPEGTQLYFSSLEELKNLFNPYLKIIDVKLIKMTTGSRPHIGNYIFMEKKLE